MGFTWETETLARRLIDNKTQDLKSRVKWCLKQAKPPRSNVTRQQMKAIRRLQEDASIKILPADKGKSVVIMDATEYRTKMEDLLQDDNYQKTQQQRYQGI